MSQLRAPDARPDRREGGRHGRPGTRGHSAPSRPRAAGPSPDSRIRPQLLRTALLPAVAAVLSGAAAVIFTVRAGGVGSSPSLWAALGGSGALAVAAVAAAYLGANRVAGQVLDRALALRRASAQGQAELQRVVEQLRNGEPVAARRPSPPPTPGADAFDLLGQEMARAQEASVAAVVQASQLFSSAGNEQKVEVFVNLARRLQSLVHREIQILDELEHEVEDPDLLKGLFQVDHLATRIRRHAENLAVLGGAVSRRQWSNPVTMTEVLRSAIAEVEQYPRVKLVPPMDGTLRGHAVADVIHLLAELVENATVFSAPHTQVLLRVQQVTAGLALEVEDRGLGMPDHEQKRMNALLSDPDQVNVAHLLQDGRIGLFVVSALARRHGIAVRLQSNIYGGTQAVLVLPQSLLGTDPDAPPSADAVPVPPPGAVHRPPVETGSPAAPPQNGTPRAAAQAPASRDQASAAPSTGAAPQAPGPTPNGHVPGPTPNGRPGPPVGEAPPLPLRAERIDRPTPPASPAERGGPSAAAVHERDDRPAPAAVPERDHAAPSPTRPELPKRTNQESLVPQLREAPAPRVEDEHALHDPGLMAAFRRGVDLAEAQAAEEERPESGYGNAGGAAGAGGQTALDAPLESLSPLPVRGAAAPHDRPGPARTSQLDHALPAGGLPVPDSYPPDAYPHDTAAYARGSHAESAHDRGPGGPGAFAGEPFVPGQAVPEPRKDTTFKE
ncbi:ATP-binding protein [Streptomyces griseus]|uniref:sensor histidine kinase n=1 Tax=Streptomyces globisporus TaxID=1908 RepID=UPI0005CB7593|nr:ATP-binding protein [Streptomyces globisporus]AWL84967.1 ATP-binding protein [Streptomyces globisporus]PPA38752.1 ATP-binding protein [Streptomyces griseus]RAN16174.1 ATPase [Streptomyces badius]RAN24031.1 ATPase [Streptomyces badius]